MPKVKIRFNSYYSLNVNSNILAYRVRLGYWQCFIALQRLQTGHLMLPSLNLTFKIVSVQHVVLYK